MRGEAPLRSRGGGLLQTSHHKIALVPYRKGRREKSSAEPQLQVGGLLIRGFWLPKAKSQRA